MKKNLYGMIIGILFLSAIPAQAFAVTASYQQEIRLNNTLVTKHEVRIKGNKQRIETSQAGQPHILIKNDEGYFSYSPLQKAAMKLPDPDPGQAQFTDDLQNYLQFLKDKGATITGTESVEGHECDIYEFEDPGLGTTNKVWVWRETSFPLRIESNSVQGLVTVQLSSVVLNETIDDSIFILPEGTPVMDVSMTLPPDQAPQQVMSE